MFWHIWFPEPASDTPVRFFVAVATLKASSPPKLVSLLLTLRAMAFKTVYESAFYRIEVDVDANMLRSMWLRPADGAEIMVGGTKLYEVLRDTGVERAVANAERMGALNAASKEWMSNVFFELLSRTRLKKLARVLPNTLFHRIALESVVTRAEALGMTPFMVKNFLTQEEALSWLRMQLILPQQDVSPSISPD